MAKYSDDDDEDDDDAPRTIRRRETPDGRAYVHQGCGMTHVSGGDYSHICDPFWPCTGTFCCGCSAFVSLSAVHWEDTGERVSDYRARMRARTPALLKAWRYGLGLLIGAAVGALIGLLVGVIGQWPRGRIAASAGIGALIVAILAYIIGTMVLNRVYDIDYRRMR